MKVLQGNMRVVGFSGTVVVEGAGIKPALVEDLELHVIYVAGNEQRPWPSSGIDELVARGVITLAQQDWEFRQGWVCLYAEYQYLTGLWQDSIVLTNLADDAKMGAYWGYLPLAKARARLAQWGEALLGFSERRLSDAQLGPSEGRAHCYSAALEAGQRARFSGASAIEGEARFAYRLFVCLLAASLGLKKSLEYLKQDASLDLDERDVTRVHMEALSKVSPDHVVRGFDSGRLPRIVGGKVDELANVAEQEWEPGAPATKSGFTYQSITVLVAA